MDLDKGKSLFDQKKYQEAIRALNAFIEKQPHHADALYYRAISFRKTENFKASIDDFTQMLERLPNEPSILCERGISYFLNNDVELALKDMDLAVELDPENPYRYSSRAYIKAKVDVEGAIKDYQKAVELDPKDAIAWNNLGLLEENRGRIAKAQKNFEMSNQLIGYTPRNNPPDKTEKKPTITRLMLGIFSSKSLRKEYFDYLLNTFKKK